MKFFTSEWWKSADSADTWAVFEKYETYLTTIRSRLPPSLVALEQDHTLHDSEVKCVQSNFDERTVVMVLHGWNRELEHAITYTLKFCGVSRFEQILPQQEYVEQELGDLGYWECELISKGVEVRMLFVSEAQFRIVFSDFSFEHERRA
jgi:hypothetical protein